MIDELFSRKHETFIISIILGNNESGSLRSDEA